MFSKALLSVSIAGLLAANLFAQTTVGAHHPGLYVPPSNSYIIDPTETPVVLEFGSARLDDIQSQLDAARAANPTSPIVLTLTGTYWVKSSPLTLPSETSLVLYGTIEAAPDATATSLISVTNQSKVAIAGGILEGNFADVAGIDVEASGKVNLDAVTIRNTGKDGILLSGNGNTVFDSGSAITRCEVSGARGNGITVDSITQALVLDNFIHDNAGAGIQLSSAHTSVVNNSIVRNDAGIISDANNNLISDNNLQHNKNAGVQLTSTSSSTALLRNIVADNEGTGIDFDGASNLVYDNTLANQTNLTDHSSSNWVVARGAPIAATTSQYFYPPTIDNQHASPIMNGMGRTDVTVNSGDIADVQQAYSTAQQQNPNNVIVLHLNGDFTLDGSSPLTLGSYTAVILNGTIHVTSKTVAQAITATNPSSFIAISGGTIDLGGLKMEGITFPSTTMADIDQVTVINGGVRDTRSGGGMIHLQHGSGYSILFRNTVDESGGRCIWTQESSMHYVVMENQLSNCNMDAVDFDSSTSNSFAIGNISTDNLRYGVFVEQSDSYDKIYGTVTTTQGIGGTQGHGVGVYNNATSSGTRGITNGNVVFSNLSNDVNNGFRVGSIATASGGVAESAHTYMFNNIATNNLGEGILFDTQFPASIDNYFSQMVLSGNKVDLKDQSSNGAAPPDFFNPKLAVNLALNAPVTASSTATGSNPANAVDGLAFTDWISGDDGLNSWLTVDLGSSVSFQRVILKRGLAGLLSLFSLQASDDGVNFHDIHGGFAGLGPLQTFRFAPVTARYLRVRIFGFGPADLREVGVFPE
jgi:hypothetical protein